MQTWNKFEVLESLILYRFQPRAKRFSAYLFLLDFYTLQEINVFQNGCLRFFGKCYSCLL